MTPLLFFGSDRFSAVVLGELIKQNHAPILVVTDPPKPARNASHSDAGGPENNNSVLMQITPEYILKRFGEKSFARGAKREPIQLCEEKLGIPLKEFINIVLFAMQGIHNELGL